MIEPKNGRFPLGNKVLNYSYWDRFIFLLNLITDKPETRASNGKKVLDIGCHTGIFLAFLCDLGFDAYGIDANKSSLEKAPKGQKIVQGYVPPLPFRDTTFDLVIALGLTEHIPNETFLVREVFRVLKHGAVYFCTIPVEVGAAGLLRHIAKNFVYLSKEDYKSMFNYSINELRGKCPRKMHGTTHKYYNYKYLLNDLNRIFPKINLYYWPKFSPKKLSPLIFAKCTKEQ